MHRLKIKNTSFEYWNMFYSVLRAVGVLFSPMVSGWGLWGGRGMLGQAGRRVGGGKKLVRPLSRKP